MKIKSIQQQLAKQQLKHRPTQLEMIEKVYQALTHNEIMCIEAPTGTGKTLSYLLASFYAKKKSQKVIISTATIALQEQLIEKDLPLLESVLGEKVRYTSVKGRQNYLCLAKLHQQDEQPDLFATNKTMEYLLNQVNSSFWSGDKETLSQIPADQEWTRFTTDGPGCSGKHCEYFEECYFYKARNKMHSADFIVTNHSMLLSDLELGSGVVLPEPEDVIYLIDECHHLPERSIAHFAKSSLILGATEWINQVNFSIQRAINAKIVDSSWQQKINQCTLALVAQLKQLKSVLDLNTAKFINEIWRVTPEDKQQLEMTQQILSFSRDLNSFCLKVNSDLEEKLELQSNAANEQDELQKQHAQLKFLLSKVSNFLATWELFCHNQQPKEPPVACWFEKLDSDYLCHSSPINVSQELKTLLWDKIKNGALLCSATIRSLGSFNNFQRKTGLKTCESAKTHVVPAIFNYHASLLFVPTMQHEPAGLNQERHRQEALALLPDLILPNSGTLVLFTSRTAMLETFDALPPAITLDILMQGQQSKIRLVEQHKKRIDAGKRSILFGLASFAEGIDLPAEYCQHVIIHKLPFAVPTTPLELTRSEWISQHRLNPFMLSTLPETSIKLTQYAGRLIRQEEDIGIITILDKRLYTKNYGKQLLGNLPPFTQLINASLEKLKNHPTAERLYALTVDGGIL